MALPPSDGADHVTVADALPGVAVTAVGAPGAVGAPAATLNTTVAISHVVLAPVWTRASGVAPMPVTVSSARNSMSPVGETSARWVKPLPAARVSPKPESV